MSIIYQQPYNPERTAAVSDDATVSLAGVSIGVDGPAPLEITPDPLTVGATDQVDVLVKTLEGVADAASITLVQPTIQTAGAGSVTITPTALSLSATDVAQAVADVEVAVSTDQTLSLSAPTIETADAGALTITPDVLTLQTTDNATASIDPGAYSSSFFSADLSANASECQSGICETTTQTDSQTDTDASNVAGETFLIDYTLGFVSSNADGYVQIEFLDGSGSVLQSTQDDFDSTDSGENREITPTAPAGTEQIRITRSVTASSQNTGGGFQCSTGDCSNEAGTIEHPITVNQTS